VACKPCLFHFEAFSHGRSVIGVIRAMGVDLDVQHQSLGLQEKGFFFWDRGDHGSIRRSSSNNLDP
jgi:hypothetical protein